ncbi:E3 ubiquitin ligase family protein [Pendulispora brunnea]|uniref:RING-type E3 ubiquitin transferase n=1 Tax=Pendulispora brunnea TaxID=2905690 RepID=A0ABZ2KPA0_9BACT
MLLIVGVGVLLLGIVALGIGLFEKMKAGRVSGAPLVRTGDAAQRGAQVAASNGAISVQGSVFCQQPLSSPVTRTGCLHYSISAEARWKEGDQERSQTLAGIQQTAHFAVDDGSGPVWIDATRGGDFETTSYSEIKEPGMFTSELVFGDYRISTSSVPSGARFEVRETVLPLVPQLYACGVTATHSIAAPEWRSLILSTKSRDELLGSATQTAKVCLIGGIAALAVGAAVALAGAFQAGLLTRASHLHL